MNETIENMITRRSCRAYLPKAVPEELLDQVLLAGTYAANGRGKQAGKILVLRDPEEIAHLEKMNADIMGTPGGKTFYGAPVVLIVLADATVPTAVPDGSLVMGNLMLAAHSLGLGSCWIHRAREEFESDEGKAMLKKWGIEGQWIGVGHCVLGYPDGKLPEAAPRKNEFIVKI